MNTKWFIGLLSVMLVFMTSCQETSPPRSSWIPDMEQTGFEYLTLSGERIQKSLQTGREQLAADRTSDAMTNLVAAEDLLRVLLYYDIPMTEARQLVYDAGRLHALNRSGEAMHYLGEADAKLKEVELHGGMTVQPLIQQTRAMLGNLRVLLEEEGQAKTANGQVEISKKVAEKFYDLGHKINLLALKKDLVLSGADFTG